jgi:hypothetical protein
MQIWLISKASKQKLTDVRAVNEDHHNDVKEKNCHSKWAGVALWLLTLLQENTIVNMKHSDR